MNGGSVSSNEDSRLSWLSARILSCLKVKQELYTRLIGSENRQVAIAASYHLNKGKQKHKISCS